MENEWSHTSLLLAQVVSLVDGKRHHPNEFNPMISRERVSVPPDEAKSMLSKMFGPPKKV